MAAVTQVRILVTAWTNFFFGNESMCGNDQTLVRHAETWFSNRTAVIRVLRQKKNIKKLRRPGIEPGSTAWKAAMLTIIPPTLYSY